MTLNDLHAIVASRLEDMADRVEALVAQGDHELANLLRTEGLELAEAFDQGDTFLFIGHMESAQ